MPVMRRWLVVTLLCGAACTSFELPEESDLPSIGDDVRSVASRFDVAVEPTTGLSGFDGSGRNGDYTAWLTSALRESGLFHSVEPLARAKSPTLLARVDAEPPRGCYLAFLASVTFGIVPEPLHEPRGYAFSLRLPDSASPIRFDCRYEQTVWIGWITGIRNVLPGYSNSVPEEQTRFKRLVAAMVRTRLPELVAASRESGM